MKRFYHFCFSLENELLCRAEIDYYRFFNSYAYALLRSDSSSFADCVMSNHFHALILTENPAKVSEILRKSYGIYFNNKYGRRGRFGKGNSFFLEIVGKMHMLAAISYVLRNPLHHGVSGSPFGYEHSSARLYFADDLGFRRVCNNSADIQAVKGHLLQHINKLELVGKNWHLPDSFLVTANGQILRESVTEVRQVEHLYGTVRNYLFYMNRLSGEEWKREQEKDYDGANVNFNSLPDSFLPIQLENIENVACAGPISLMLENERGKFARSVSDTELCSAADDLISKLYGKGHTIYTLSPDKKSKVAELLYKKMHISPKRIKRCLVL